MTGCSNGSKAGEDLLSQRDGRDDSTDIRCRDDGRDVEAASRPARASIERIRPCATGLRRITACRRPVARDVVDELATPAQEPSILDALDRAPDEGVGRAPAVHESDDDGGAFSLKQRAGDAHGGESRRPWIGARRVSLQPDCKASSHAFGLDLVHIAGSAGIGDELDLVASKPRPASATAAATLAFCG